TLDAAEEPSTRQSPTSPLAERADVLLSRTLGLGADALSREPAKDSIDIADRADEGAQGVHRDRGERRPRDLRRARPHARRRREGARARARARRPRRGPRGDAAARGRLVADPGTPRAPRGVVPARSQRCPLRFRGSRGRAVTRAAEPEFRTAPKRVLSVE